MTFEGVQLQGSLKIMEKLNVSLLNLNCKILILEAFKYWLFITLHLEGTINYTNK